MSGIRGMMKEGWHPKGKDGGRESWRGDYRGVNQVAGWVGMRKDNSSPDKTDHVSLPLSSLKDPASFGPPPKRSHSSNPGAVPGGPTPDQRRVGASPRQSPAEELPEAAAEDKRNKPAPPSLPYRAGKTGISVGQLPPPTRHSDSPVQLGTKGSKPTIPPRLPPRNESDLSHPLSPPPAYSESESRGQLNQGAISRLGQAGISVPSFGIGGVIAERRGSSSSPGAGRSPVESTATNPHLNELQSRFSKMTTGAPSSTRSPSSQGTTVEEKQAALRTAQNFHKDPSSVSAADAKSAVSTANSFRERHSDQIEAGKKKLSAFNQKYQITKRINEFIDEQSTPADSNPDQGQGRPPLSHTHSFPSRTPSSIDIEALNKRKPPPPPPPPKPHIQSASVQASAAPPPRLPLETKPR